jgi:hypothetical protein
MNPHLRAILAAAVLAVTPAFAGEATSMPTSASAGAPTEFARIAKDAQGRPVALQLAIVTYAPQTGKDDFSVDLVSAIHVGDKVYYHGLNDRFRAYDALLYELVIPDDAAGARKTGSAMSFISITQKGLKNALGLTFQLDEIDYGPENFVHADLTTRMLAQSMADRGESLYVYFWRLFYASIDEYARDPLGLNDWRLLSSALSSRQDDALKIAIANELVRSSAAGDILGGENGSALIAARNQHAVGVLKDQIDADAKQIGIFYGVAHMADFEQRLFDQLELSKTKVEWVDAWRFADGMKDTNADGTVPRL